MDILVIQEKLDVALKNLLENDLSTLKRNLGERAIAGRLAKYLRFQFPKWDVDTEYNRDEDKPKRRKSTGRLIQLDINVHIAGDPNPENNILVIQLKKSNNLTLEKKKEAIERLCELTSQEEKYKYNYNLGALIVFHVGKDYRKLPEVTYFQKGETYPKKA